MTGTATRYLYVARHGEAETDASSDDGGGLTETGRRQAYLLGRRLRKHPISAVHHGPLPRAVETARHAMAAPEWRWLGLNHGNASLTVIRYSPDRPVSVLVCNDMRHLPDELCWTGFSSGLRP